MKDIVFLGGLLVVLMYVLGITQGKKQEKPKEDEWEVVSCERLERFGDTIVAIQTLVKRKQDEIHNR